MPSHWKEIEDFFLVKYEDQLKVAELMNCCLDISSDVEKDIKAQSDEFFGFLEKLKKFKTKDMQMFLRENGSSYEWPKGRPAKVSETM